MTAHKDPRVDAYIARSADFAKPILNRLRAIVHQTFPDVEETIKWGFPFFLHHGILGGMSAFKQHCAFILWKGSSLPDPEGIFDKEREEGMGHLGRITDVSQLPTQKIFKAYLMEVAKRNEADRQSPKRSMPKSKGKKELKIPDELSQALKKNKKAAKAFEAFSPSNKKEYADWIVEAKAESTRSSRLKTAMEWIEEGKPRNWTYMGKYMKEYAKRK